MISLCPYICNNKTEYGYCKTGACINPAHRTFSFTSYDPIKIARQYAPKFDKPVVDLVEVVRCKDCKYMTEHYDTDGNVPYWTCSEWDSGTDYDGYCHYEEKQNKKTKWNTVVNSNNSITYYCPKCGSIFNKGCADLGDFNFCPNCGADMRGE